MIRKNLSFLVTVLLLFFSSELLFPQNEPHEKLTESEIQKPNGNDLTAEQIFEMNKPYIVSIWYFSGGYYSYYSYYLRRLDGYFCQTRTTRLCLAHRVSPMPCWRPRQSRQQRRSSNSLLHFINFFLLYYY